jgi:hypothetical protein
MVHWGGQKCVIEKIVERIMAMSDSRKVMMNVAIGPTN